MTPHDSLQQSRSPLDKWWGVYGPALLRIKRDTEHYLAVTALVVTPSPGGKPSARFTGFADRAASRDRRH
jgi:hypothetical protein